MPNARLATAHAARLTSQHLSSAIGGQSTGAPARSGACDWIRHSQHLVIGGPTGTGKSWLACALGHKACREGFSVLYRRAPRLFAELATARGECRRWKVRFQKQGASIAKAVNDGFADAAGLTPSWSPRK